jgi:hypothetical protein
MQQTMLHKTFTYVSQIHLLSTRRSNTQQSVHSVKQNYQLAKHDMIYREPRKEQNYCITIASRDN